MFRALAAGDKNLTVDSLEQWRMLSALTSRSKLIAMRNKTKITPNAMILYKYFPPHRHTFFYKPMLRFTPPEFLNDPFGGKASYKGIMSQAYFENEFTAKFDQVFEEQLNALPPALRTLAAANNR